MEEDGLWMSDGEKEEGDVRRRRGGSK